MPRLEALITAEVLGWARENIGVDISAASKRAGVSEGVISQWEVGEARPTVRQARLLANLYRIPFAALFLDKAPAHRLRLPKDYRRLAGTIHGEIGSAIRINVQDAWERREIILELLELSKDRPQSFDQSASLNDDPEEVGTHLRKSLGMSMEEQASWKDGRRGFNAWRARIEEAGVLVFQAVRVPLDEMRACSLRASPLPIIVVNRKDVPQARTFSLLHELSHHLLKSDGLCDLSTRVQRPPEEQRLEVFCNAVAAVALMPGKAIQQHPIVLRHSGGEQWSDLSIVALARHFSVSREALLRRLLTFELTTNHFYELKRQQYREEYLSAPKSKGFLSPSQNALSMLGRPFVQVVLSSLNAGQVTTSDAADYLGVRLKHLPALTASLETD